MRVDDFIAVVITGVFCILTLLGVIGGEAFVGVAVYVIKKYLDNKKEDK